MLSSKAQTEAAIVDAGDDWTRRWSIWRSSQPSIPARQAWPPTR